MINNKYIYINETSLSSEFCLDIIELFENNTNKRDGITLEGVNKNIKDTVDLNIPLNDEKWYKYSSFLKKELNRNIIKYLGVLNDNKELVNDNQLSSDLKYIFFNNDVLSSDILLMQRYKQNTGKYIYHNDFALNPTTKKYRVITFLWYINTVEEGGETCFGESFKIKPEQGKLILFPACWTFPHCGKVPLSGDKYIVTGWLYRD